jgi:hypothetical protein
MNPETSSSTVAAAPVAANPIVTAPLPAPAPAPAPVVPPFAAAAAKPRKPNGKKAKAAGRP